MSQEKYLLKKERKEKERLKQQRRRKINKMLFVAIGVLVVGGGILGGTWWISQQKPASESESISKNGLHWHADLSIKILGEYQEIPANIGLGITERPIHTHDADGVIHLEFSGKVLENDIRLGRFFKVWGKTFTEDCIFDKCSGAEGQLKMLVNGFENSEFENYAMQDNDKIEIIFEPAEIPSVKEFIVSGTEFSFNPSSITVSAGERVKMTFINTGEAPHNLVIEDLGISTKIISGGQTDAVEFTAPASGTYAFICSVPGHRAAGMEGQLKVE